MTGLEYMRTVCPTTKRGKDPLREDVMDAFEDGIAEGWKQAKEKQWKPSDGQIKAVKEAACYSSIFSEKTIDSLISLSKDLKKLKE